MSIRVCFRYFMCHHVTLLKLWYNTSRLIWLWWSHFVLTASCLIRVGMQHFDFIAFKSNLNFVLPALHCISSRYKDSIRVLMLRWFYMCTLHVCLLFDSIVINVCCLWLLYARYFSCHFVASWRATLRLVRCVALSYAPVLEFTPSR